MPSIRCSRREHELSVRRDVNLPRARSMVRERDSADFRIVIGRDNHIEQRRNQSVLTHDLRAIFGERDFISVGCFSTRLEPCGPGFAIRDVAQKDVCTGIVARCISMPPRNRNILPATEARAGAGDHHGVSAVREQISFRRCGARIRIVTAERRVQPGVY